MNKQVLQSTFFYFAIGAMCTGSIYKLIENPYNESYLKLIFINLVMMTIAFVFSYFWYKRQQQLEK